MAEEKKTDIDPYIEEYLAKVENPNIMFVISRTKNKNIVVYEARVDAGAIRAADPVDAYWLDIDPEYMAKNRAKGKDSDREDLNMIERRMAYGCAPARAGLARARGGGGDGAECGRSSAVPRFHASSLNDPRPLGIAGSPLPSSAPRRPLSATAATASRWWPCRPASCS